MLLHIWVPDKYIKARMRTYPFLKRGYAALSCTKPLDRMYSLSVYAFFLLLVLLGLFLSKTSVFAVELPLQAQIASKNPLPNSSYLSAPSNFPNTYPQLIIPHLSQVNAHSAPNTASTPSPQPQAKLQSTSPSLLWNFTSTISTGISGLGYSVPVLGDVDTDGKLEIIFGDLNSVIYALNAESGTQLWNKSIFGENPDSSPSLGNLDSDTMLEVVIRGRQETYAIHVENRSILWHFPNSELVTEPIQKISSPVLADINNDSQLEVIQGSKSKYIYALNGTNGKSLWDYKTQSSVSATAALGDIDNDQKLEVIIGDQNGTVYALNAEDGSILWDPVQIQSQVVAAAALGDIDNDQKLEVIITGQNNIVYALNGEDGTRKWNYTGIGWTTEASPSLGDIDNDRKLEIVQSCYTGSFDQSKIYVLNAEDGSLLWERDVNNHIISSITLGDLNNDNKLEIVFGSYDCMIYALNAEDGAELWTPYPLPEHWRYDVPVYQLYSSAVLRDINNDSQLEVVIGISTPYDEVLINGSYERVYGALYALDFENSGVRTYWQGVGGAPGPVLTTNLLDIDPDMDYLSSYSENLLGTDPEDNDTDDDGLWDGWEVNVGLDPLIPDNSALDSDQDGLTDQQEHDLSREYDWARGLNPLSNDTDGDGLADNVEVIFYTLDLPQFKVDPTNPDTDGDGLTDGEELIIHGTNPVSNDTDTDGLADGAEIAYGTQPRNPDSDNDHLKDGEEVYVFLTDPRSEDTDRDRLKDGMEVDLDFDPTDEDMDDDGLTDGEEYYDYQTNLRLNDTDGDGLLDGWEVENNLDPNDADTDGDGDPDGLEVGGWLLDPRDPLWNTTTRLWLMIGVPTVLLSGLLGVITYKKREIIRRRLRRWWIRRLEGTKPKLKDVIEYAQLASTIAESEESQHPDEKREERKKLEERNKLP
ncbi:MAG: PQQ-binding-like beta-propeller repeat protein [Promethearchaeota archaeon]